MFNIKQFIIDNLFPGQQCQTRTLTDVEVAKEEYMRALGELRHARENMDNVGQDYLEITNDELNLALKKFSVAFKNLKDTLAKEKAKVDLLQYDRSKSIGIEIA